MFHIDTYQYMPNSKYYEEFFVLQMLCSNKQIVDIFRHIVH